MPEPDRGSLNSAELWNDEAVYHDLRRLAARLLKREDRSHTLQATALLNEVWIRLNPNQPIEFQNVAHFYGVAIAAMRRLLVDHARARPLQKRSSAVTMADFNAIAPDSEAVLALDMALEKLAKLDSRASKVVELRVFGGLSTREIADVLGAGERSVERDWAIARSWLHRELSGTE